jgi:hypothetical protein
MLPDHLVCSGRLPSSLNGLACPYSVSGRMPEPMTIEGPQAYDTPEVGQIGDQAPPCAVRHFGSLADWLGPKTSGFPDDVLRLRLFECRQRFLLVVPGLLNERR